MRHRDLRSFAGSVRNMRTEFGEGAYENNREGCKQEEDDRKLRPLGVASVSTDSLGFGGVLEEAFLDLAEIFGIFSKFLAETAHSKSAHEKT